MSPLNIIDEVVRVVPADFTVYNISPWMDRPLSRKKRLKAIRRRRKARRRHEAIFEMAINEVMKKSPFFAILGCGKTESPFRFLTNERTGGIVTL